jgi:tRNA nucleotidyltransferase (CCA-adding enzyme)
MHVILTHEQADFDALASLLGACLLYDGAIAILPRRLNRNVRAFLSLYGADLPFIDPRDLPTKPIEEITIVDTQTMVSLKGVTSETKVKVIDHHPLRDGLPTEWSIINFETGATATLLVEALQEHNGLLSPVHATLMLLGIYEDTGSLTYSRTTSRDLKAAALLIELGASLAIAGDFLNHPLSFNQQELYDRLRASMVSTQIHGYNILVACGDAHDMDEELSTIAHKLRDLLEPDALFLLVTIKGGVQLIARSSTDNIDAAAIAQHFGGGGHERAAAGLIKAKDCQIVLKELLQLLPEFVRPALTVSQIMSHGVQVLSPEDKLQEAARKMRIFGYEGYPVVSDGKVVGLLTRRAVDRALSHNLSGW